MTMATKKQQSQLDEYQNDDRTFMQRRLKWVEEAAKKLFTPGELEDEQPCRFDD